MGTLTKQKTQVATVRALDQSVMQEICMMFRISEPSYFKDQYHQYEHFVEIAVAPSHMQAVRYSKLFRGFWNNEWAIRNKRFVEFLESSKIPSGSIDSEKKYFFIHDAVRLAGDDLFMAKFNEILMMILRKEAAQC